jgi:hypothetical protein
MININLEVWLIPVLATALLTINPCADANNANNDDNHEVDLIWLWRW